MRKFRHCTAAKMLFRSAVSAFLTAFALCIVSVNLTAQTEMKQTMFRVGERLTYRASFERFSDVAFAELYVASAGRIGGKEAVEIRSRFKTLDFFSSAFYMFDETRTTFASPETGLPLYSTRIQNASALPKETINNYLVTPTQTDDLITMIYRARQAGGSGVFSFLENERLYQINLIPGTPENIKTEAGEFQTTLTNADSPYFSESSLTNVRINFNSDERRIPVLIRCKTPKGEFRLALTSVQIIEPETVQPIPVQTPTPRPTITPRPVVTPTPYIENQPLAPELSFELGEVLEYRISTESRMLGIVTFNAKERRQFEGEDSLLLTATITSAEQGNGIFNLNDTIRTQVDPETLAPQQVEIRISGSLRGINQIAQFDQVTGAITFGGTNRVEAPIGTHSMLSLFYAVRSFNLRPSKYAGNPVNDTRVAVFWNTQPYVFTLRPSVAELITLQGEKVSAQLISVNTGNPQLDQLGLKLWLSNDDRRIPLRFSLGSFQADLISQTNSLKP